MLSPKLKGKLAEAKSLDEIRETLKDHPGLDANQIWKEVENHRSARSEKLDVDELEAVSGGF